MDFKIGEIDFNSDQTVIIAEAGVNHLGRMDYAEELVKTAKRAGADQCMTLINNSSYSSLLNNIGIDITIDPKIVTISKILEKVRSGRIMSDYTISDGFGEVIEAEILPNSAFANQKLSDMNLPSGIRVGAILRENNIIIPNSKTIFKEKDDVVFFSETNCVKKLERHLSIRQQYS